MTRLICAAVGVISVSLLGGCTAWVNIPAQRGDMASHSPNDWNVQEATAAALRFALAQDDPVDTYGVGLLPGTTGISCRKVFEELPGNPQLPGDLSDNEPVYQLKYLQIRGWRGEVGMIPPPRGGSEQLLTVYLKRDATGWFGTRSHLWRMPLAQALRFSRSYKTAPATTPPPEELQPEPIYENGATPTTPTAGDAPTTTSPQTTPTTPAPPAGDAEEATQIQ